MRNHKYPKIMGGFPGRFRAGRHVFAANERWAMRDANYIPKRCEIAAVLTVLAALLVTPASTYAQWPKPDPVRDLRLVLQSVSRLPEERHLLLERRVEALSDLHELQQALTLEDWRDEGIDEVIAAIDRLHRSAVVRRFEQRVRDILHHGDDNGRLAVIQILVDIDATLRRARRQDGLGRRFSSELMHLAEEGSPRMREGSLRALGRIHAEPREVAMVMNRFLRAKETLLHQAAADALFELVRIVAVELAEESENSSRIPELRNEMLSTSQAVLPAVVRGLDDADARVRFRCAETLELVADFLAKVVVEFHEPRLPSGDKVEPASVSLSRDDVLSLALAFTAQTPRLARALDDENPSTRFHLLRTIEMLAVAQTELISGPVPATDPVVVVSSSVDSTVSSRQEDIFEFGRVAILKGLAQTFKDPDVRARLKAIDVLEALGPAATPAVPALVLALGDQDRFVRWAAARALGKIPLKDDRAIPALVDLLNDPDLDARLAAARTLRRFGPDAAKALPRLADMVKAKDTEARLEAIRTLGSLGTAAKPAVPVLAKALDDPDVQVRRLAALMLGRIGPSAREAADRLSHVLDDSDAEVRKTAGEALLLVTQPTPKLVSEKP